MSIPAPPGVLGALRLAEAEAAVEKANALWSVEDPEEEPYKTKYVARKLMEDELTKHECFNWDDEDNARQAMRQRITFHRMLGQNYFWCEEVATGEKHYLEALAMLLKDPERCEETQFSAIQATLNNIGNIWLQRGSYKTSLNFLRRAQIMYQNAPAELRRQQKMYNGHMITTMYLAQAYNGLGKSHLSAKYCTITLSNQLQANAEKEERPKEERDADPFNPTEWIRNCTGISDFFVSNCMFWTAEYLLHSADLMIERAENNEYGPLDADLTELKHQVERDLGNAYLTRLKYAKARLQNPGGDINGEVDVEEAIMESFPLDLSCAADGQEMDLVEKRRAGIVWDDLFPECVTAEEDKPEMRLSEEDVENAENPQAPVSEDGVFYVQLGDFRVRLGVGFESFHDAAEKRMKVFNAEYLAHKKKDARQGVSSAAQTFEEAREVFKLSNHYYAKALDYFKLDGWVSDHIKILQEISSLYDTLGFFEKDESRQEKMLLRRAKMLGPLCDVINMNIFLNLWRQISFEVGEVYQTLFQLKIKSPVPDSDSNVENIDPSIALKANKWNEAGIQFFQKFLLSFEKNGEMPSKVEDENLRAFVLANLYIARSQCRFVGINLDTKIDLHSKAVKIYRRMHEYAKRNEEQVNNPQNEVVDEMAVCKDMLALLPTNIDRFAKLRARG